MYSINHSYPMRSNILLFWTAATHTSIVMMPTHMHVSVYYINYTSDTVIKHSKPLWWFGIWCNDPCSISHYSWDEESFTVNETAFPIIWFITPSHFTSVRTIYPHLSEPSSLRTLKSRRTTPYTCPNHSSKIIYCISPCAKGRLSSLYIHTQTRTSVNLLVIHKTWRNMSSQLMCNPWFTESSHMTAAFVYINGSGVRIPPV